jgi:hypothetical protein
MDSKHDVEDPLDIRITNDDDDDDDRSSLSLGDVDGEMTVPDDDDDEDGVVPDGFTMSAIESSGLGGPYIRPVTKSVSFPVDEGMQKQPRIASRKTASDQPHVNQHESGIFWIKIVVMQMAFLIMFTMAMSAAMIYIMVVTMEFSKKGSDTLDAVNLSLTKTNIAIDSVLKLLVDTEPLRNQVISTFPVLYSDASVLLYSTIDTMTDVNAHLIQIETSGLLNRTLTVAESMVYIFGNWTLNPVLSFGQ